MGRKFGAAHNIARGAATIALVTALGGSHEAFAFTQCQHTISNIYTGDNGYVWIAFKNSSGSVEIPPTNSSQQATLSAAITALVGSRTIIVRYSTDGVDCNNEGARTDFQGLYLY